MRRCIAHSQSPSAWLVSAFALMVGLLALVDRAQAAFPGANGKISFSSARETVQPLSDVYTMNPDGTAQAKLYGTPSFSDTGARWSADGSKVAFMSNLDGDHEIYVMAADGTNLTKLTNNSTIELAPAWSPDGTKITFQSNAPVANGPAYAVWVMNADGSGQTRLNNRASGFPAWSPDGSKIAFSAFGNGTSAPLAIWTINPDGTGEAKVPLPSTNAYRDPNWSPDGSKLAMAAAFPGTVVGWEIATANPNGTNLTRLTTNGDSHVEHDTPAWSPDGTKIAFYFGGTGWPSGDIYTMNPDGTDVVRLTTTIRDGYPDWQPCPSFCPANRNYDVPTVASPLQVSLVPDFRQTISSTQCGARGGTTSAHGAPLAFTSCQPPAFAPGTQAHMGPAASAAASLVVVEGVAATPTIDEADLTTTVNATDIRQGTASGADYDPIPSGADTTLVTKMRLTDLSNCVSNCDPSFYTGGTVLDFELNVPVNCAATADPSVGATCNANTSMDAIYADSNAVKEGTSMIVQAFRVRLKDSGANGTRNDGDDRSFAMQGIYIP